MKFWSGSFGSFYCWDLNRVNTVQYLSNSSWLHTNKKKQVFCSYSQKNWQKHQNCTREVFHCIHSFELILFILAISLQFLLCTQFYTSWLYCILKKNTKLSFIFLKPLIQSTSKCVCGCGKEWPHWRISCLIYHSCCCLQEELQTRPSLSLMIIYKSHSLIFTKALFYKIKCKNIND